MSTPNLLPRALAALAPLLLLGAAAAWLSRPMADDRPKSAEVVKMEESMASEPQVVLVGNSMIGRGVDVKTLAKELGVAEVASLTVASSRPPAWYAVVKNRVFQGGHKPDLVIIGAQVEWLLDDTLDSEFDRQRLDDQLNPVEPLIEERLLGREASHPRLMRARSRRVPIRSAIVDGARDLSVGLFFGEADQGVMEAGRAVSDDVFARVFGDDTVDMSLQTRVIPVVEAQRTKAEVPEEVPVTESFLMETVRLVREQGSQVIVVRMPVAPSNAAFGRRSVGTERELVEELNALGAGYLDLHMSVTSESSFYDPVHLNRRGMVTFTDALGEALKATRALTAEELAPAPLPRAAPVASRVGKAAELGDTTLRRVSGTCRFLVELPELSEISDGALRKQARPASSPVLASLGGVPLERRYTRGGAVGKEGCEGAYSHWNQSVLVSPPPGEVDYGDPATPPPTVSLAWSPDVPLRDDEDGASWWVLPGTALRFAFSDSEAGDVVEVRAEGRGGGSAPPSLQVGSHRVDLARRNGLWTAELELPADEAPEVVEILSPDGGPYLLLDDLMVGGQAVIHGATGSSSLRAFGVAEALAATATYKERSLALSDQGPPTSSREGVAAVSLPSLDMVSDSNVYRASGFARCSPVEVLQDGAPLTGGRVRQCAELGEVPGQLCHGNAVEFTSLDGVDAAAAPERFTVRLNPDRWCHRGYWLYPQDIATYDIAERALQRWPAGADTLELDAVVFQSEGEAVTGQQRVRVVADEEVILDTTVSLADFADGPQRLSLGRFPSPSVVSVELDGTDQEEFVLLTNMSFLRGDGGSELSAE